MTASDVSDRAARLQAKSERLRAESAALIAWAIEVCRGAALAGAEQELALTLFRATRHRVSLPPLRRPTPDDVQPAAMECPRGEVAGHGPLRG